MVITGKCVLVKGTIAGEKAILLVACFKQKVDFLKIDSLFILRYKQYDPVPTSPRHYMLLEAKDKMAAPHSTCKKRTGLAVESSCNNSDGAAPHSAPVCTRPWGWAADQTTSFCPSIPCHLVSHGASMHPMR